MLLQLATHQDDGQSQKNLNPNPETCIIPELRPVESVRCKQVKGIPLITHLVGEPYKRCLNQPEKNITIETEENANRKENQLGRYLFEPIVFIPQQRIENEKNNR